MVKTLREYVILGVKISTPFLIDLLNSQHFRDGEIFTDFIDIYFKEWKPSAHHIDEALIACIVDNISREARPSIDQSPEEPLSPWKTLGDWRIG